MHDNGNVAAAVTYASRRSEAEAATDSQKFHAAAAPAETSRQTRLAVLQKRNGGASPQKLHGRDTK